MFPLLLREALIRTGIQSGSKQEIFSALLETAPEWKLTEKARRKIQEILLLRESFGTTAVGEGIALPHAYSDDVTEPFAILGISASGVEFASLDGAPVHVVFLLVLPEETEASRFLKVQLLREARRFFTDAFVSCQIKALESGEQVQRFINVSLELPEAFETARVS